METTLKQRLIGAAVLIALAVIFIPMILDGSGQRDSIALNMQVPPDPEFTFESKLPDIKELEDVPTIQSRQLSNSQKMDTEEENDKKELKTKRKSVVAKSEPKPKVVEASENHIKKNPSLNEWAVQVAAFGEKKKALELEKKLLAANFSAFTEKVASGNKTLYRVKVGPELERKNADKLKNKIEKEQGLEGIFVIKHP